MYPDGLPSQISFIHAKPMVSYQYANKVGLGIFWDLTIRLDVE